MIGLSRARESLVCEVRRLTDSSPVNGGPSVSFCKDAGEVAGGVGGERRAYSEAQPFQRDVAPSVRPTLAAVRSTIGFPRRRTTGVLQSSLAGAQ